MIGTLLINEIWETVCRKRDRIEYYFIIDEFANYVTQDIPHLLEEAAKRDIHLILIHQQPDQVKSIAGSLQSAQTKITFSLEADRKDVGRCTFRRFNHEEVEVKTLEMADYHIPPKRVDSYSGKFTKKFLIVEQVDERLKTSPNEIPSTAIGLLAEIGDINWFAGSKQLVAYAGLATSVRQSNERDQRRGITKQGRKGLRGILIQAVLTLVRGGKTPLKDFYLRKKQERGTGKAICATARKLLVIIFVMLKKGVDYRYREDHLYNGKLSALRGAA